MDDYATVAGKGRAFDVGGEIHVGHEIGDGLGFESDDAGILALSGAKDDAGRARPGMAKDFFGPGCLGLEVGVKPGVAEGGFVIGQKNEVVNPFKEVGGG